MQITFHFKGIFQLFDEGVPAMAPQGGRMRLCKLYTELHS